MEINRRLMVLMDLPVTKPERLYQCGTWSTVYPPLYTKKAMPSNKTEKENKDERKKNIGGRWKFGVQYEPWET